MRSIDAPSAEKKLPLIISLPWPPSMNTYWRHVVMGRSARTLLSKKGREYRQNAASELLRQGHVMRNLQGPMAVHITAYPPDRRKRDLDNLPKSILDALTHANVWGDDSQVDDLRITRGHIVKFGAVAITITPMSGEQQNK
jgi:crossover junction endodeoxyribonuclease RusA